MNGSSGACLTFPNFPDDHYVDVKRLRQKAQESWRSLLYTLLLAIDGSTDNVFFDFDYEYWQAIELSIDSCSHSIEIGRRRCRLWMNVIRHLIFLQRSQSSTKCFSMPMEAPCGPEPEN